MVLQNDIAKYLVVFKKDETIETLQFDTFAAAAGAAGALTGIRFINVSFRDKEGHSSISGSLYCYNEGNRRVCNQYLVNEVLKRGGV